MTSRNRRRHREAGAALLLMMLVVVVAAISILVAGLHRNSNSIERSYRTSSALADAKNALLSAAVLNSAVFDSASIQFPCPDLDSSGSTFDGESHTANCGATSVSMLGRLPWKTLGISAPHDGAGECLWYVVSGEYKNATAATSPMINPDTNGQLQLFDVDTGLAIEGQVPDGRPIAMIISPGAVLATQIRQALAQPEQQCSGDFSAQAFLDADAGTGISNALLTGGTGLEQFIRSSGVVATHNDRVLTISREEVADLVYRRHDFQTQIRGLTNAIAGCLAAYGLSNPGGPTDRRLPWPAPVGLSDYRLDSQYSDVAGGILSGRVADEVDDSSAQTGNTIAQVLTSCSSLVVPAWGPTRLAQWRQWKDHFFYYVADSFRPSAPVPSNCGNCISVNGTSQFAAVVVFANRRLNGLLQVRNAPPLDTDTKNDVTNYLEGSNAAGHPYVTGSVDLESRAADAAFNDILFCIDSTLAVSSC